MLVLYDPGYWSWSLLVNHDMVFGWILYGIGFWSEDVVRSGSVVLVIIMVLGCWS